MNSSSIKPKVLFLLSIDTEEEWDWSGEFPYENCSVSNTQNIPKFQAFCESLGIRPTYMVDYAIADDPKSVATLKPILQNQQCEIGAHLHPWCNPPLTGPITNAESHVVNLPIELTEQKLIALTEKLRHEFGQQPRSFRTGRWGINKPVMDLLEESGYTTDSSVYPYYSTEAYSCENAYDHPYWPDSENPLHPGSKRGIFELPITAGFNQPNFPLQNQWHQKLSQQPWSLIKPIGMLWHTRLLRKIYLSPELASATDMKALVKAALVAQPPIIHMFLHSSSLKPGCGQFIKTENDEARLYESISSVVEFLQQQAEVEFCTLSEATEKLTANINNPTH